MWYRRPGQRSGRSPTGSTRSRPAPAADRARSDRPRRAPRATGPICCICSRSMATGLGLTLAKLEGIDHRCGMHSAPHQRVFSSDMHRKIEVNGDRYELAMDAVLQPFVERILTGTTENDRAVDVLDVPQNPSWLVLAIAALRWYRGSLSPMLGHRCVFDPSCSRYAELAIQKHGLLRGVVLVFPRLIRCRPGTGGVALP